MSPNVSPDRPAPAWVILAITLTAVLVATLTMAPLLADLVALNEHLYVWLLALAYLAMAILLRVRPRPFLYGALAMLAVLSIVWGAFLLLVGRVISDQMGLPARSDASLLVAWSVIQLALVGWAVARIWRGRSGRRVLEAALGMAVAMAFPTGAMALSRASDDARRAGARQSAARTEQSLRHAALRIQRCAIDFAMTRSDSSYPSSLEALRNAQPGCFSPRVTRALDALSFEPKTSADGRVTGFILRATIQRPGSGTLHLYGNESGQVVNARFPERLAAPTDSMVAYLEQGRRCAEAVFRAFPVTYDLTPAPETVVRAGPACHSRAAVAMFVSAQRETFGEDTGYWLRYHGEDIDFRIEARPVDHGRTGLRSYAMARDGTVRVTLANRRARDTDAALRPCTGAFDGNCVPKLPAGPR